MVQAVVRLHKTVLKEKNIGLYTFYCNCSFV